ncbi:MAG: PEP-CTERM sorting domain-containing protein [Planctomycetia bacterium]|nr:PEP-CTERM sorting domain-containing protein [Planctomycetia bacterium]
MRRAMAVGVAIGFLTLIAVSAQAGTMMLNGSTVLFDSGGYEDDTPGTNPGNVTAGSSWVTEYSADRIDTYGPNSGGPGAFTGHNYMRFYRGLEESSFKDDYYWNGWSSPNPVAVGNRLKVEYAVYVDSLGGTAISGDGTALHTSFSNAGDGWFPERVTWTSLTFPDGDVWKAAGSPSVPAGHVFGCYYDGAWKALTSGGSVMTVAADAWHTMAIDLTVGTGYTMMLDGVTSDPVALESGLSDYTVQSFKIWSNADARNGKSLFYLDAVPEPSTAALLLCGALAGLAIWGRGRS